MSWYAIDAIDDAVDATRAFLTPFSLGRWGRLALITFFLGTGGIAGQFSNVTNVGDGFGGMGDGPDAPPTDPGQLPVSPELGVILAVVGVILVLGIAFSLVGAVMEFVFVDALATDEVHVRSSFGDRLGAGVRLFAFRIGLTLLVLVPPLAVVLAAVTGVVSLDVLSGIGFVGIALAVLVFGLLAFVVGLVQSFTNQFVVPVMVATEETVLGGWRELYPVLRDQLKQTVVYVLLHTLVGIGVGIVRTFLLLVGAIPVTIVAVVVGLLAGAVAGTAGGGPLGFGIGLLAGLAVWVPAMLVAVVLPVNVVTKTYTRTYELRSLAGFEPSFDILAPSLLDDGGPPGATPAAAGGGPGGPDDRGDRPTGGRSDPTETGAPDDTGRSTGGEYADAEDLLDDTGTSADPSGDSSGGRGSRGDESDDDRWA
ncbi:hypothetical protein RYH80_02395 [Halobaculum sp. MBLA0147]|uniref:DUF7544 domain-containing protein n=1 Tax=Halobaculum sp. MBLA0147 TaxID=3079934 RepID=UPI003524B80B